MLQLALAANVPPQALAPVVMAKSAGLAPASAMLVMFSVALPELESVAVIADAVLPTVVLGKARVCVSLAMGAGAVVPVPVIEVDCVAGVALSVTTNEAAKLLADAGVNVT
jgi:hypothetical protein